MMDKVSKVSLREENKPLDLTSLSGSQNHATHQMLDFIHEALETSTNSLKNRTNRLLFISGDKGSGKSSLVYTLRNEVTDFGNLNRSGKPQEKSNDSTLRNRIIAYIQDNWQQKIRWLEPISMDPLPPGANLAGALFGRIEDAVGLERERGVAATGLFHTASQLEKVRHALDALKSDALMAIEGNLDAARGHMDPENFSLRAGQAELNRVNLNNRLNAALNTFFSANEDGHETRNIDKGIFIQVIDDLDLRPERAVEMLKLAYSLSIPRLFFIILGDENALDQMLFYDVQGEFGRLLAHQGDQEAIKRIEAASNEHSSNLLRKMLPLAQRIRLKDFEFEKALNYGSTKAKRRDENNETLDEKTSLQAQLEGFDGLGSGALIERIDEEISGKDSWDLIDILKADLRNVTEFGDLRDGDPLTLESQIGNDVAYDGSRFLTTTPRHLADFYQVVSHMNVDDKNDSSALIEEMQKNFDRLVDEDGQLGPLIQDQLRNCVSKEGALWEISPPSMQLQAVRVAHLDIPVSNLEDQRNVGKKSQVGSDLESGNSNLRLLNKKISLGGVTHYDIEILHDTNSKSVRLGARTRPAFKLLHDLTLISGKGVVAADFKLANPEELACTVWDDRRSPPMSIPWSTFQWKTFWHRDEFTALWRNGVSRLKRIALEPSEIQEEGMAVLASLFWIGALTDTVTSGLINKEKPKMLYASRHNNADNKWKKKDLKGISAKIKKQVSYICDRIKKKKEKGENDIELYHLMSVIENIVFLASPEVGLKIPENKIIKPIFSTALLNGYENIAPSLSTIGTDKGNIRIPNFEHYNDIRLKNIGPYVLSPSLIQIIMKGEEVAAILLEGKDYGLKGEMDSMVRQLCIRIGHYLAFEHKELTKYVSKTDIDIIQTVFEELKKNEIKTTTSYLNLSSSTSS